MIGTTKCIYKTPCGWCSKWDKQCDKKIPKIYTTDDTFNVEAVRPCGGESDHEWECCGISTEGTDFRCKKCGANKTYKTHPADYQQVYVLH